MQSKFKNNNFLEHDIIKTYLKPKNFYLKTYEKGLYLYNIMLTQKNGENVA